MYKLTVYSKAEFWSNWWYYPQGGTQTYQMGPGWVECIFVLLFGLGNFSRLSAVISVKEIA